VCEQLHYGTNSSCKQDPIENHQKRLEPYIKREMPVEQAGLTRGRGTRDQIANLRWIMEKAREHHKNVYLYFI
jgi:hypothetical protein